MLYLTCTTITSVYLAHYGISRAKDWVSVGYGTIQYGVWGGTELYKFLRILLFTFINNAISCDLGFVTDHSS